ncbi:intraflagellar transport protein 46 homolog isoform X2 [Neocloeon triangulifer]|uniref:intraflagellar transport protein 46 homolog isoform X2 n=1 Tax=Neocloeon triangulifer TaxID=2078957 RepID=UPI00286F00DA|nr:intraflagellar transport protein 46 homolog isoform X2 [Neocloeon triangulifer]
MHDFRGNMLEPDDEKQDVEPTPSSSKQSPPTVPTELTGNHNTISNLRRKSDDQHSDAEDAEVGAVDFPDNGPSPDGSSSDDDDSEEQDPNAVRVEGTYDPAEFAHLSVPAEVKELFNHITRYTPQITEIAFRLRPFIPDFIPAIGDIDAFLKVPRCDNVEDKAGLVFLDEPGGKQSDPAVLNLQLRAVAKQGTTKEAVVKRLENAEQNMRAVDKWIRDIQELHRNHPPPSINYTRLMPDVDSLMQEWPPEVEMILQEQGLPPPDLDCSLENYIDLICGILDIPVYESRVESLHVLFSVFLAVKQSKYDPTM